MKEVIWHAPCYDPSGYASCAREYIFALYKLGVKIKVDPVRSWSQIRGAITEEQEKLLRELEHTQTSSYATRVQHTVPDCYRKDKGFNKRKLNIGYTVFETDSIPKQWAKRMDMMDKIFVPTKFNQETFVRGGFNPQKMIIIPHIVNTDKFDPSKYDKIKNIPRKEFYFDILLRAYLREFKNNKDVGLILKAYFGGTTETHKKNLMHKIISFKNSLKIKNPPDIIFYGDILIEPNLCRLYKTAHVFVYPTRGEGWGLGISESLSMELPVIVTNWSGHLEFCKEDNSYLINVLGFERTSDQMLRITPNYTGQRWAVPSESDLRSKMRYVYEHYSEAKEKAKRGRQFLKENFNWKIIGEKIIKEI